MTEMTITLARSLIKNKGIYNRSDIILSYLEWANSGTKCLGKNTRTLLKGVKTINGYANRYNKEYDNNVASNMSNGALMRCSPLACLKDFIIPTKEDCKITNPHLVCIDSELLQVNMLHMAIRGKTREEILEMINKNYNSYTPEVKMVLDHIKENKFFTSLNDGKKKGWCLNGLYCSLYCLLNFNSFQDGIDWVIRQPNSDTDTNGAIAGALLGALIGYTNLTREERTGKNITILLNADTTKGDMPRQDVYTLKDIDYLVDGLYNI